MYGGPDSTLSTGGTRGDVRGLVRPGRECVSHEETTSVVDGG